MAEDIGITREDRIRISEYLEKYPYDRRPEDLLPGAEDAPDER